MGLDGDGEEDWEELIESVNVRANLRSGGAVKSPTRGYQLGVMKVRRIPRPSTGDGGIMIHTTGQLGQVDDGTCLVQ